MSLARYYAECAEMRGVEPPPHHCSIHRVDHDEDGCPHCEEEFGEPLALEECAVCGWQCVPDPAAMGCAPVCADCSRRELRAHDEAHAEMAARLVDYARPYGVRS